MKIDEILDTVKMLASSQGFYGRLYARLMDICAEDPETWARIVQILEAKNFIDPVDFILFLES